jgi:hypothetical protein
VRSSRRAVGWIEIEDENVGFGRRLDAARPDVKRDAALVREVDERFGRIADRIRDLRLAAERDAIDRRRIVLLRVLLEEAACGDAFREALHRERAAAQLGEHHARHIGVVRDDITFRDAFCDHAIGVRDVHYCAPAVAENCAETSTETSKRAWIWLTAARTPAT